MPRNLGIVNIFHYMPKPHIALLFLFANFISAFMHPIISDHCTIDIFQDSPYYLVATMWWMNGTRCKVARCWLLRKVCRRRSCLAEGGGRRMGVVDWELGRIIPFKHNPLLMTMKCSVSDPDSDPLKKALIWIRVAPKQTKTM